MTNTNTPNPQPWETLDQIIQSGDAQHLQLFLRSLSASDVARTISRLDEEQQAQLFAILPPEFAADIAEELPHAQAADIIEDMPADIAAAIVDEMDSDEQVDILSQLDDQDSAAIIQHMAPDEVQDVLRLSQYPSDSAGGIMITEYLAYSENQPIIDVIKDLRENADQYREYHVQYIYLLSPQSKKLRGMVRMRELILAPDNKLLKDLPKVNPKSVHAQDSLDSIDNFFARNHFGAVPVIDIQGTLLGIVTKSNVEESLTQRSEQEFLRFGGIIAGEERREDNLLPKALRRLVFLAPNAMLCFISISIILFYEAYIKEVPVLAAFMPLVAAMSGASANQAIAVSFRELTLGLVKPHETMLVVKKEIGVGLFNGIIIGLLLALAAFLLDDSGHRAQLALVVGLSFLVMSLLSVSIGGCMPLLLKKCKIDPAMAASPLTTVISDACSFWIVLNLAIQILNLQPSA